MLAAGLDESKGQALLAALARHGASCELYLLAAEAAPHPVWSRAEIYCAGTSQWGTRACGCLAELVIIGTPVPP